MQSARIVEVAEQCFKASGYAGTTMSQIAIRVGGSKSTLWHHFQSKEKLFAAVVEATTDRIRSTLLSALDPAGEPRQVLQKFALHFIEAISSPDAVGLQRMIIGESSRFPEIGLIFHARAPAVITELLSDYMSQLMASGAMRTQDARAATRMLLALASGGLHQRILWGIEAYRKTTAEVEAITIVDQVLRACGAQDPLDRHDIP